MEREILKIDEDKCTGCGLCVPNCHEGALQIIDGKVRLISELMCDGLGACIGHCPEDAITIEKREAQPYDEVLVMKEMLPKGYNTIKAHLSHLKDHNETGYLNAGIGYLESVETTLPFKLETLKSELFMEERKIEVPVGFHGGGGCPGSASRSFGNAPAAQPESGNIMSELTHWPVQLHLINPASNHFHKSDLLFAADCVAFSFGDFHRKLLKGKTLTIACPKLDEGMDIYYEKIKRLIQEAEVNTITIAIMQVPCCGGLSQLVQRAVADSGRKVPVKKLVIGIQGEVLSEEWV